MLLKFFFLVVLCATFAPSSQHKITWVKLNTSPVCFGAKHDTYGAFTYGKRAFVWAFMLKHRYGYVTCDINRGAKSSSWGCDPNDHKYIGTYLTDESNNIVGPRFREDVHSCFYSLPGYRPSSSSLIFFMGKSPYGLHHTTKLRLWYGEDLKDYTEGNNGGKSCADVYGLMNN